MACGGAPVQRAAPTVAPAVETLGDAQLALWAGVLAAADARRADSLPYARALSGGAPLVRRAATLAIGQARVRVLAPRLVSLLADADTGVAADAAFALGLLHDTSAVQALAGALHARRDVGAEAAWALGEIGGPARAVVEQALHVRDLDDAVAGQLLLAAAKLHPVPVAAVAPWLGDGSSPIAWRAAYAIARPRDPAGIRLLLPLAVAPDAAVREQVARALTRGATGDSLAAPAVEALRRLVRDPDPHVRIAALRSVATFGALGRPSVVAATHDTDANVRIAAAQSAGAVLSDDVRDWTPLWAADTGFMYRRSLLASSMQAGARLPDLEEWEDHPDWRYRAALADAAGASRDIARVAAFARPLSQDYDPRVRVAAYAAAAPWAAPSTEHPWRRRFFLDALRDEDAYVRATALDALAGDASAAEVPAVLASYRRAAADSGDDARVAAIRFLAAAWRRDSAAFGDSLRALIAALPAPADPLERAAGRGSPLFAHWGDVEGTSRPLAWYEGVLRSLVLPSVAGHPPIAEIVTDRGSIAIELLPVDAPLTVENFVTLARSGFYSDTRFHRVVPAFVAQDGDPRGDGNGGPGYAIRDELNRQRYDRGVVGMALSGPDTGGSQYFITLAPQPHLDGQYTVFGRVRSGLDVLDALVQGDHIQRVRVR